MKKLFFLLLAMMICVLPFASMAEETAAAAYFPGEMVLNALEAGRSVNNVLTVTEVSGINTGDADVDAAIADLLKALSIKTNQQGDEVGFALGISDTDVLTLSFGTSGNDVYLKSNLLGDALVFSLDEVEPLLNRLLDMLVMMEALTEEDVAMLKEELSGLGAMISAALDNQLLAVTLTEEDLLAMDFSAVTTVLEQILAKAATTENPVVPGKCDPAVGGMSVSINNEEMIALCKAIIQCVESNPQLMSFIAYQFGFSTEAQLTAIWDAMKDSGYYASEEEFREYNPSLESILKETLAELENAKILDGDYVINLCMDEVGLPVYMTFSLPLFIETESLYTQDELEAKGETTQIDVVYARQTVTQGVSHVVNLTVDEESLTADILVSGNKTTITLSAPEAEPILIDVTVDGNSLIANLSYNPDEETSIACTLEGRFQSSATDYELAAKLTMVEIYTPAEVETPSLNGMTLPGFEAQKPKPETNTLVVEYVADYIRDGVDFAGVIHAGFSYNDLRIVARMDNYTADPAASVMSGTVIRPAELDDAAFANWFVGVVNTISSWTGNLMMALPESVLSLLMYSGM